MPKCLRCGAATVFYRLCESCQRETGVSPAVGRWIQIGCGSFLFILGYVFGRAERVSPRVSGAALIIGLFLIVHAIVRGRRRR
jgi:hypothetical protein